MDRSFLLHDTTLRVLCIRFCALRHRGYWNYILKADYNKEGTGALDLTKYYGLLPHGKSAYVYDAEAGTVVFTSGIVSITAKLLREGDYSYGSSTLSVPGIAFDFALPGQTTQGAYP